MKWISLITVTMLGSASVAAQTDSSRFSSPRSQLLLNSPDAQKHARIEPGSVALVFNEINKLLRAKTGNRIKLPSLDGFTGNQTEPLEFERVDLFAPGAKVRVVSENETILIEPRLRYFFLASNSTTAIGLAVDPETGITRGYAIKGGGEFEIMGTLSSSLKFAESKPPESGTKECATALEDQPVENIAFLDDGIPDSMSAAGAGSTLDFEVVVAIDTDTEWLAGFDNDTTAASDWIQDLFLAMNVMFERDVATRLLLGDVFLRTGPDPYTNTSGNRLEQMYEFGEYWRVNQGGIDRSFAAMLSGRNIGAGSFSGIAWLNLYCENGWVSGGRTIGSYSYNAIGNRWTANSAAKFIGHELGHNMGSPHTHCYNPPVDECYGGEGGCFSGPASCPASGAGTTMSYCHLTGGCRSTPDFHPTVQALLGDRLAANSPACISPFTDPEPDPDSELPFFQSGFE